MVILKKSAKPDFVTRLIILALLGQSPLTNNPDKLSAAWDGTRNTVAHGGGLVADIWRLTYQKALSRRSTSGFTCPRTERETGVLVRSGLATTGEKRWVCWIRKFFLNALHFHHSNHTIQHRAKHFYGGRYEDSSDGIRHYIMCACIGWYNLWVRSNGALLESKISSRSLRSHILFIPIQNTIVLNLCLYCSMFAFESDCQGHSGPAVADMSMSGICSGCIHVSTSNA